MSQRWDLTWIDTLQEGHQDHTHPGWFDLQDQGSIVRRTPRSLSVRFAFVLLCLSIFILLLTFESNSYRPQRPSHPHCCLLRLLPLVRLSFSLLSSSPPDRTLTFRHVNLLHSTTGDPASLTPTIPLPQIPPRPSTSPRQSNPALRSRSTSPSSFLIEKRWRFCKAGVRKGKNGETFMGVLRVT